MALLLKEAKRQAKERWFILGAFGDRITRYFFCGGTMPAADLLLYFQMTVNDTWDDVSVVDHWLINGKHYSQTEWLKRMDKNMGSVRHIMEETHGKGSAVKWTVYWRTFVHHRGGGVVWIQQWGRVNDVYLHKDLSPQPFHYYTIGGVDLKVHPAVFMEGARYPYGAPSDSAFTGDSHFPGHPSLSMPRSLPSYRGYDHGYSGGASSAPLREDRDLNTLQSGPHAVNGFLRHSYPPELSIRQGSDVGILAACSSRRGCSSLIDDLNPSSINMGREFSVGISSGIANGTSSAEGSLNGLQAPGRESNVLFVAGLPSDCTRREVSHLFRPFVGFKDIRVIHKVARRKGDTAMVLCFVEFDNVRCAYTAMEALQGYTFDHKKPDSSVLKIQFAHFPIRMSSEEPFEISR
ncbi:hypothetical protein MLD38_014201 [Melastoma candidum]|uniref:Uncharacterized protein n=1 Tax=Melastoma candidum TaxID=119954 RepID=A0ACB9RC45_9MYRT|nr:hypothetical protein MLD38_014201 [Melastoma candidum]